MTLPVERRCRTCRESKPPATGFSDPNARRCNACKDRLGRARPYRSTTACKQCGQWKLRGEYQPRATVCDACKADRVNRLRACARCGTEHPAPHYDRYGKLCSACRARPRACLRCWDVKPADAFDWGNGSRGEGKQHRRRNVCRACITAELERREQRRRTWVRDGVSVRRCSLCGETKPLKGGFYTNGLHRDGTTRYQHWCRTCSAATSTRRRQERMLRDKQYAAGVRAWRATYARQWRTQHPDRARAASQRYMDRVRADPERHAAWLEARRMEHRLRRERRDGVRPENIRNGRVKHSSQPAREARLPIAPLAAAITRAIQRERGRNVFGYDAGALDDSQQRILKLVDVNGRLYYAWQRGEREQSDFNTIDRVLVRLELQWWDVYDETTLRLPVLTVRTWRRRERRFRGRPLPLLVWEQIASCRYGDAGPDHEQLRVVREAFEGQAHTTSDQRMLEAA